MSHSNAIVKHAEDVAQATLKLESNEPSVVVQGLNVLTKKSFEAVETSNLQLENYPQLALSLGSLLEVVNPLKGLVLPADDGTLINPDFCTSWETMLSSGRPEIKMLTYGLDDNQLLLATLNILRNLSFDTVNEHVMAASAPFIVHLVSIVLLSLESKTIFQATHLAVETLINIAGRIDLTGRKRLQGYYFSEDAAKQKTSTDTLQRNMTKLRMSRDMSTVSFAPYVTAVTALMSAIVSILCADSISDRTMTLRAVELLGRIATNPDNAQYLSVCPQVMLDKLVQLLGMSTSHTEPLVSDVCKINGDPFGRRRPPAMVHVTSRAMAAVAAAQPAQPTGTPAPAVQSGVGDAAGPVVITFDGVRAESLHLYASGGQASATNLAAMGGGALGASSGSAASATTAAGGAARTAQSSAALNHMTPIAPYFVDGCDQEMRDTVIDALHALAIPGSTALQIRMVRTPHLVPFLLRISRCYNNYNPVGGAPGVGAGSGHAGGGGGASNLGAGAIHRTEAMVKALQILNVLLGHAEGSRAFLALQSEFVVAACWDDYVADVVCNKALPMQQEIKARQAYALQQQQQLQQPMELQYGADSSQALYA